MYTTKIGRASTPTFPDTGRGRGLRMEKKAYPFDIRQDKY